jgi:hypothetical protein
MVDMGLGCGNSLGLFEPYRKVLQYMSVMDGGAEGQMEDSVP